MKYWLSFEFFSLGSEKVLKTLLWSQLTCNEIQLTSLNIPEFTLKNKCKCWINPTWRSDNKVFTCSGRASALLILC